MRSASVILMLCLLAPGSCGDGPTDALSDRIVWRVAASGLLAASFDAERAFFVTDDHEVIAVDKMSGAVQWRERTTVGNPRTQGANSVVAGDVVAVGDVGIFAFRRSTGESAWTFQPANGDWPGQWELATDGATIYAGTDVTARVYAVDAATGEERWAVQLATDGNSRAWNPAVQDGVVYVGLRHFTTPRTGSLVALDAATGDERWRHDFEPGRPGQDAGCEGGAVFYGSSVIVAADDGQIYAFDRITGEVDWVAPELRDPWGNLHDADIRRLTVSGSTLVAGSSTTIVVGYDAETGNESWRTRLRASVVNPLASDAERAYVTRLDGRSAALDVETGALVWEFTPSLEAYPVVDSDRLYQGGSSGLYALKKP